MRIIYNEIWGQVDVAKCEWLGNQSAVFPATDEEEFMHACMRDYLFINETSGDELVPAAKQAGKQTG